MKLPTIQIESHQITRLIIGGNPYSGISRADKHIMRTLNEYWNTGGNIQWIAQTPKSKEYNSLNDYLQIIARYNPIAIYHHGGTTDMLFADGKLHTIQDNLKRIRELGCAVGIGTHDPHILKHCYTEGFDVDFYVCALYNHTKHREMYLSADRDIAISAIQAIPTPVIAIKVLAAGRNEPNEAFKFALENIKPNDPMAVGMYTRFQPDQIQQNAVTVLELIRKIEDEKNSRTRSNGHSGSRRRIRCNGAR